MLNKLKRPSTRKFVLAAIHKAREEFDSHSNTHWAEYSPAQKEEAVFQRAIQILHGNRRWIPSSLRKWVMETLHRAGFDA